MRGGGDLFDRVIANMHREETYVRMNMNGGLAIMNDNDVTQTKYIAALSITIDSPSIGDSLHIVIDNVTQNMGTSLDDIKMTKESTTISINNESISDARGTWTSTILPDESRVELYCDVIGISGSIVTAKCLTDTNWPNSVFNRLPLRIEHIGIVNHPSYTEIFIIDNANIVSLLDIATSYMIYDFHSDHWSNNNRLSISAYDYYGKDTFAFGDKLFYIQDSLPTNFVNHWVNTVHAELLMMYDKAHYMYYYGLFVPPESP